MSNERSPYVQPEIAPRVHEARYFFLHRRQSDDPRLVVVCGGRETCAPGFEVNRSTFPYFAVEWVERGRGEAWLRGKHHELMPGSVFCYGPGVSCRIATSAEFPLTKCFLDFTGGEAAQLLETAGLGPGRCQLVVSVVELSELFNGMLREGMSPGPETHAIEATYLRLFLLKVKARGARPPTGGTQRLETFLRCRQFLQDHYLEHPNIESAARALGLTPSYLCRLFREHGELSPYQFLLRARMNHALDHLLISGGSIKAACYASGFRDPAHFSRLFKKAHGLSPRALAARVPRIGTAVE